MYLAPGTALITTAKHCEWQLAKPTGGDETAPEEIAGLKGYSADETTTSGFGMPAVN
jgi:hypothetical protein